MAAYAFGPNGFTGGGSLERGGWSQTFGQTALIPRVINCGHNGSSSTQTKAIHVSNDLGMGRQGGYFFMTFHGWQTDRLFGFVDWQNNGSTGGITAVRWNAFNENGVTVTLSHDSNETITVTLTNTHTNSHGWQWHIWGPK